MNEIAPSTLLAEHFQLAGRQKGLFYCCIQIPRLRPLRLKDGSRWMRFTMPYMTLAVAVHLLVVVSIFAGADGLPPGLIVQIPVNRLLDSMSHT